MRYALFAALALASGSAASAQTSYTPPEMRITRNSNGVCYTGSILVTTRDDVVIGLYRCQPESGTARTIAVTNSPGAVTGDVVNVDTVTVGDTGVTITGVSGQMAISGDEETIVRRCLAVARSHRADDSAYRSCLEAGLGTMGYTIDQ